MPRLNRDFGEIVTYRIRTRTLCDHERAHSETDISWDHPRVPRETGRSGYLRCHSETPRVWRGRRIRIAGATAIDDTNGGAGTVLTGWPARVVAGLLVVGAYLFGAGDRASAVAVLTASSHPATRVAGTPCTPAASACVDLTTRRAWLIRDGAVVRGPVPISTGGPGEETPLGTFRVWRKDPHHISFEQHGTPMPYSVFFDRGIAFHAGPLALMSAGCVHLRTSDATAFYAALRLGDQVQVRTTGQRPARQTPTQARRVPVVGLTPQPGSRVRPAAR